MPPAGQQGTPPHIWEFDASYIRDVRDRYDMHASDNIEQHEEVDYFKRYKVVEAERERNPYEER